MTLLYIEGFDAWNMNGEGRGWYNGMDTGTPGRFGDGRFGYIYNQQGSAIYVTPSTTLIVGCAFKLPGATVGPFRAGVGQMRLYHINASNSLALYRATELVDTSNSNVCFGTVWNYLEMKVTFSATVGSYAVRLNGVAIPGLPDATNVNTGTDNTYAYFDHQQPFNSLYIDDVYIANDSGSTNNDFLGDVRVETLRPVGAGSSTQWTPSAGSNYQTVDEAVANDDTDYVAASGVGVKDMYDMSNLATTVGTIFGVQCQIRARKTDSGTRGIAGVFKSGASEADTTTFGTINASYLFYSEMREDKPGGTGWTIADVNAMELGVKITE